MQFSVTFFSVYNLHCNTLLEYLLACFCEMHYYGM